MCFLNVRAQDAGIETSHHLLLFQTAAGLDGELLLLNVSKLARHASLHVVEIVAVEQPATGIVGAEHKVATSHHRRNDQRIFKDVAHLKEMTVQMHRMRHHAGLNIRTRTHAPSWMGTKSAFG